MGNERNKRVIIFSKEKVINYLFILSVFIVTRQFPLSFLSPVMNLAVILIIFLSFINQRVDRYSTNLILLFLIFPITCSLLYSSFFTDNKITYILKFYVVLLSVGLAYFVKVDKKALKAFLVLCLLQVFILLSLYLYIIIFLDSKSYLPIRFFFLEREWGDIYTYNGFFYRIQLKGNALLVIAFILNLEIPLFKRKYLVAVFFLIGVILAGNFAYSISVSIYLIYKLFNTDNIKSVNIYFLKFLLFAIILILVSPFAYDYVVATLEMKSEGSLGTRYDQFSLLIKNLCENNFTLLLGQGLGNTLDVQSSYRNYTGDTYFELQIIYILNQLGIIFFGSFIVYNILIVIKKWGKKNFKIYFTYFIYISYAITNPYILDTNQIVVIIVLNSWLYINKLNEQSEDGELQYVLQG